MKQVYLFALLLASLAFSGCVQSDQELGAIALADQLVEVRLLSKVVDIMQRADQCTFDKFYAGYKRVAEIQGIPFSEPSKEQKQQIEAMIQQAGALAKRCQIRLSKKAEKESENIYIVHYDFETIDDPECNMLSTGDAQIRVDLSTGKAEAVGSSSSSQDMQLYEQIFNEMEECAAITMIEFAQMGSEGGATSSVVPPGRDATTITVGPEEVVVGAVTTCANFPQDDKDRCIRAMVLSGREPASKCNEISDETIKADCIANASDGGDIVTEKVAPIVSSEKVEAIITTSSDTTAIESIADCENLDLPEDIRDMCILRLVLNGSEPASKCNEISDETIKAECIANSPAN